MDMDDLLKAIAGITPEEEGLKRVLFAGTCSEIINFGSPAEGLLNGLQETLLSVLPTYLCCAKHYQMLIDVTREVWGLVYSWHSMGSWGEPIIEPIDPQTDLRSAIEFWVEAVRLDLVEVDPQHLDHDAAEREVQRTFQDVCLLHLWSRVLEEPLEAERTQILTAGQLLVRQLPQEWLPQWVPGVYALWHGDVSQN